MTSDVRNSSSAADLFVVLWDAIADTVGTAATAAMFRRAASLAGPRVTAEVVVVKRNGHDYEYRFPDAWKHPGNRESLDALRTLSGELRTLLMELTGSVIVRHLDRLPGLAEHGIFFTDWNTK